MIPDIYWLTIRKSLKLVFTNIYNRKTTTDLSVFFEKRNIKVIVHRFLEKDAQE